MIMRLHDQPSRKAGGAHIAVGCLSIAGVRLQDSSFLCSLSGGDCVHRGCTGRKQGRRPFQLSMESPCAVEWLAVGLSVQPSACMAMVA